MQKNASVRTLPRFQAESDSQGSEHLLQDQIECLLDRLQLAVVFGGDKFASGGVLYQCHNTRSWKSYEVVAHDIAASLVNAGAKMLRLAGAKIHQ